MEEIHIIFDGPPSHESGRFVEVEDGHGKSINTGEWRERSDGLWALVIPRPADAASEQSLALQAVVDAAGQIDVWQLREFAERRSMNNYSLGKSLRDGMPGPIRALHDALNRLKSERGNAA